MVLQKNFRNSGDLSLLLLTFLYELASKSKVLESVLVEDAGEREEKQRDEPSQFSALW